MISKRQTRSKSSKKSKHLAKEKADLIGNTSSETTEESQTNTLPVGYHIGCSGWSYQDWNKKFYKNVPQKEQFKFFTQNFDTVEINNTFYKFPAAEVISKWQKESPENFIFTIKAPRMFTHTKKRFEDKEKLQQFYSVISKLGKKLGCVLFQFPRYCKYDKTLLDKIVSTVDYKYKNVIEFRHHSWWNDQVFKTLTKNNLSFCNFSSNMEGITEGEIHHTAGDLYIRFHGKGGEYNYSDNTLSLWTNKIKNEIKPTALWVYFNNDLGGHAVYNAFKFIELLK